MKLASYPSIYNIGHRAVAELLKVPVYVEEKVDGSQISFGVSREGELQVRSKGAEINPDAPEKMFTKAVEQIKAVRESLVPGWVYRGEYLQKPKHNTLAYSRVPERNIILFDINPGEDGSYFLDYGQKYSCAKTLGFELVPLIYEGLVTDADMFRGFLDRESILGGQKVEGVVVKPVGYGLFGPDKKVLMAKYVSEAFREVHAGEWKKTNPGSGDIVQVLAAQYKTEARWLKGVQHLREAGKLEDSPRDIGTLLKEVSSDLHQECAEEIKDKLFKWAWPQIQRRAVVGLPEWYKDLLMKRQFGEGR